MKTAARFLCASTLFTFMVSPYAHATLLIDSFVTPQSAPGAVDSRSVADGAGILGGERDIISYLTFSANGVAPNQLHLSFPNPDPYNSSGYGVMLNYDGNDNNPSGGSMGGLGSVDLTQGGLNDRFRIYVSSIFSSSGYVAIDVNHISQGSRIVVNLPASAGFLDIPFSTFIPDPIWAPANFQNVGHLQFNFVLYSGEYVVIDDIVAVPEPTALSLLSLGIAAGTVWRRRKRGWLRADG